MKKFTNFVDEARELKVEVLSKIAAKDDRGALASLKQAWREVEAVVARGI